MHHNKNPFTNCKSYHWENLFKYFKSEEYSLLDNIFENPTYSIEEREGILNETNLNGKQKIFLWDVFDIDSLIICGREAYLVEEKSKDVDGKEFNRRQVIYLDSGTTTQYSNLKKASSLGINTGILLILIKYDDEGEILLEQYKYYPIDEVTYMKNTNRTKIKVDDFIRRGRKLRAIVP